MPRPKVLQSSRRLLPVPALLAGLLFAAPALAGVPKAAMLGVNGGEGLAPGTTQLMEELLLNALHRTGRLTVIGRSDVVSMLGFERQKQLLGCDDASCMAEISGALGVRYLVAAHAGRLGAVSVVTLKLIDGSNARVVARADREVRDDAELPRALEKLAGELVDQLPQPGGGGKSPTWSFVALGVGGASAIAGTVLALSARGTYAQDTARAHGDVHGVTQADYAVANGRALMADVAFAVAAVGLVAGGIGFFAAPSPGGGGDIAIAGRF